MKFPHFWYLSWKSCNYKAVTVAFLCEHLKWIPRAPHLSLGLCLTANLISTLADSNSIVGWIYLCYWYSNSHLLSAPLSPYIRYSILFSEPSTSRIRYLRHRSVPSFFTKVKVNSPISDHVPRCLFRSLAYQHTPYPTNGPPGVPPPKARRRSAHATVSPRGGRGREARRIRYRKRKRMRMQVVSSATLPPTVASADLVVVGGRSATDEDVIKYSSIQPPVKQEQQSNTALPQASSFQNFAFFVSPFNLLHIPTFPVLKVPSTIIFGIPEWHAQRSVSQSSVLRYAKEWERWVWTPRNPFQNISGSL